MNLSPVPSPDKRKLLDRVRDAIRLKHYSSEPSTPTRIGFILFHKKRHPAQMAEAEVTENLPRTRGKSGRFDPKPGPKRTPLSLQGGPPTRNRVGLTE